MFIGREFGWHIVKHLIFMKKKIKVLHIAQAAGGVDRYLQMLFKYFDKEKFENILVCSNDYNQQDYIGLVDSFEQINMIRKIGFHDFKAVLELRKEIIKYKPDIVYAHSSKAGAIARIANIGLKNKCIYNPHGWSFNMQCSNKKRFLYRNIEKVLSHFSDKIICISDAEKDSALKNSICKENKLEVIYNGIDIDLIESQQFVLTRQMLNIPEDAFVVGMVGRVTKQKSPDIFIRVAKCVKKVIPNSYFIIVGNGEMESEIINYAKENDLFDNLLITGWVKNPLDYVNLFDVATLLSRWEGFGLVLPEYMIMNKPIIASRVDAIPNIIKNKENGLLVNLDDIGTIVDSIKNLYENTKLANDLVDNGKREVRERFDVKNVSLSTSFLMEKLLDGKN